LERGLRVNAQAELAEQVLPMPGVVLPVERFPHDAPKVEHASFGFVHRNFASVLRGSIDDASGAPLRESGYK